MSDQLVHYSAAPVTLDMLTDRRQEDRRVASFKPHGFWFSVDGNGDGWRDWCVGQQWRLEGLTHVHDVTLAGDANILWLRSTDDLDAFHDTHRIALWAGGDRHYLDWPAVAAAYDGIVIAPYLWARRLSMDNLWYYSWDCASGCVWNVRAIASVTLREIVPVEPIKEDAQ